jgi:outer membrane protein
MVRYQKIVVILILFFLNQSSFATDLLDVYRQALVSDPIYQQAISQRLATQSGVAISVASLLPNINVTANPTVTRNSYAGSDYENVPGTNTPLSPRNITTRAYTLSLNVTQTVFNAAQYANVAGSLAAAKGADAILNSALQNLMLRVANAYFTILKDQDNLLYSNASKLAYKEQLSQVKQQYQVGLKTLTEVYTAQASYETAVANDIEAETQLANDQENLRIITGKRYSHLAALKEAMPLIAPSPNDIEAWVVVAQKQNWNIKAAQYAVDVARAFVKQQFAAHLPTVNIEGSINRLYNNDINRYNSFNQLNGPGTQTIKTVGFDIQLPLFAGGGVVAQTNQAAYQYQIAQQQLEQTLRMTLSATRQNYLGVLSGISQIKADKQSIKSNQSSVAGMEANYQVGTETLVNVLNQRQKLFQAQTQYAADRYAYINSILALKQAAGTLSVEDLRALNCLLIG